VVGLPAAECHASSKWQTSSRSAEPSVEPVFFWSDSDSRLWLQRGASGRFRLGDSPWLQFASQAVAVAPGARSPPGSCAAEGPSPAAGLAPHRAPRRAAARLGTLAVPRGAHQLQRGRARRGARKQLRLPRTHVSTARCIVFAKYLLQNKSKYGNKT